MATSRATTIGTNARPRAFAAIETRKLTRHYRRARAVSDLSLTIQQGESFGYLGPNGAGKSTTLRLLLDLIQPTSGSASIFGLDPRSDGLELRRRIGYVAGEFGVYDRMTGHAFLQFTARLRAQHDTGFAAELSERLSAELDRPLGELSRGNKQKVVLVQAFMHDPDVLLLVSASKPCRRGRRRPTSCCSSAWRARCSQPHSLSSSERSSRHERNGHVSLHHAHRAPAAGR